MGRLRPVITGAIYAAFPWRSTGRRRLCAQAAAGGATFADLFRPR